MYADVPTVTMDTEDTESIEEPIREPICADCRYSQVLAVQPRTVCTHPTAAFAGSVLCAAQVACAAFAAGRGGSLSLSSFGASRLATSSRRL
jgi:hypothetical protein